MDELIHKYFLGELSADERIRLLQSLKTDPSLRSTFTEQQNVYALLDLLPGQEDYTKGEESYSAFIKANQRKKQNRHLLPVLKYVAAIAVLVVSTVWLSYTVFQSRLDMETHTLHVPAGQRACLTLHDGTTVWLNVKSTLTYPARFARDKRSVSLVGEAFFDVSKNPSAPFTVSVKDVTVKVLGTEFNIQSYPETDYVQTSLLKGSVEVSSDKTTQKVMLLPDQEVIIREGQMNVSDIRQQSYFLWKDGIYSFDKETFGTIIKKLEFYYDTKIVVTDKEILDFVYTGKFRQQDGIDEILRIIQKIHNFKIERDRERNSITLSK